MANKLGAVSTMQKSATSKMDAMRQAIAALGKDAMPVDLQNYVKKTFGLTMTTAHVSNYKTDILRKLSGKAPKAGKKMVFKKPISKPISTPIAEAAPAPKMKSPAVVSSNGKAMAVSLQDVATVKVLVGRVGESNLKSLIDLLGNA